MKWPVLTRPPRRVEQLIFGSPLVTSAPALPDVARAIGIPEDSLVAAVARYNRLVAHRRRFGHRVLGPQAFFDFLLPSRPRVTP